MTQPAELYAALEQLRLDGAIFFRAEFSESWAYESPPTEMAGMLHPGAERLIMFHLVAAGQCWVEVEGTERHWAQRGDVIVLPYGDQHRVGGTTDTECISIARLFDPPPWSELPVLSYGGGGERTDMVCGYLHSEDPLFDPQLRAFPPAFVVRPTDAAAQWVQASIEFALDETAGRSTDRSISRRLPELLLIEVLRIHLASAPAADRGWVAAFHDPVLAAAMAALHRAPEQKWTVADLASECAVSRSLLDERFRQVLGRSPIRYLTEWRMHIAENLLANTELGVAAVSRRVGYDSEEAFSRAFKRAHGLSPSHWRSNAAGVGAKA
jgi:AraC-like DNA-binding protein